MRVPEMVKPNHRYRGPIESRKMNNATLDIKASIQLLQEIYQRRGEAYHNLQTTISQTYYQDIPEKRDRMVKRILTVKGGDM